MVRNRHKVIPFRRVGGGHDARKKKKKKEKEEAKYIDIHGKETDKIRQSQVGLEEIKGRKKTIKGKAESTAAERERESVVVSMRVCVCVSFICWCNGSMMNGSQIKKKKRRIDK